MRNLVTTLVVCGCALFWAAAAVASGPEELSCGTTKCTFPEELGSYVTKYYHGHCDEAGIPKMTTSNSSMICHKTKWTTCTKATLYHPNESDTYWQCRCVNSAAAQENTTIDLSCPSPS